MRYRPILQALLASVLFSTSAPAAKLLLGEVEPIVLAALLYLGSGIGLSIYKGIAHSFKSGSEARLSTADLPWLAGAIMAGGIAAPILLMFGLIGTTAATASLLLNFEAAATSLIAAVMFKEALDKRIWGAVILITAGSAVLTWDRSGSVGFSIGALGIVGACVCWGLDNNLTRHISAKDPLMITIIKGLGAGSVSLGLAFALGNRLPQLRFIAVALVLGFAAYGLSIVLFISSMRSLGAARTCAYFATAPFIGAVLSLVLFRQSPDLLLLAAAPLMIVGVVCLVREQHEHMHTHEAFEHEHGHAHEDEHHHHEHEAISNGFHSYRHKHDALTHSHPHTPDIHHRHIH
ncbi:MAG: DMT family transporter [Planctomycetaceae bacterium]|nr:DMT family transporter [Planctomycetaceae bacterium]